MTHGSRGEAEGLRQEMAAVLAPLGLRLAAAKTQVVHIDEGFDFLRMATLGCGRPPAGGPDQPVAGDYGAALVNNLIA